MILSDYGPICGDEIPYFLIFDFSTAPPFLFYSYVPIAIVSFLLALYILYKDNFSLRSKLLLAVSSFFSLWIINILVQWVASYHTALLFGWQLTALLEIGLFVTVFYFFVVFTKGSDVSNISKWLLSIPVFFTAILTPTSLNIVAYDIYWCEGVIGSLWNMIYYIIEPATIIGIPLAALYFYKKIDKNKLKQMLLVAGGATAFLLIFFLSNLAGEFATTYEVNFIGPLGMVIFQLLLLYNIIHFRTFNLKLIATEALVGILISILFALVFLKTIESVRVVSVATTLLTFVLGFLLIRSVRREVEQREEIEKLAGNLKKANKRLKMLDQLKSEFVSVASHQLRSPLTSIRGYASMLLEGSYGKLSSKAKKAIERIGDSSRFMALSVEDYLNVSRIEAGNMKYEKSDFNIKDVAERVADELRPEGIKKGLLVTFKSNVASKCIVHADPGKMKQVIQNLVDNALKYTPKGTIQILVRDNKKKKLVYIDIIDTGIGMSAETIENVFGKFERAHNANEVNVSGSGLGLFVADKMSQDMGGDVYATSDGEGKGSTFTLEMPLQL